MSNRENYADRREFLNQRNVYDNYEQAYQRQRLEETGTTLRILGDNLNNRFERLRLVDPQQPLIQAVDLQEVVHHCFLILVQVYHLFWQR